METLYWAGLICLFLLLLVTLAAVTQWAERRFPRLGRFLDRHFPENEGWERKW